MNNSLQLKTRDCIQTKHIYSLLDTPKNDEVYKKLSKHLEICATCNQEYKKLQLKMIAAKIYIPKAIMDHDLKESFEREVVELFKAMDLNNRELLKKNVKKGIKFIDRMGIDFINNLSSKNMLKTYFFAVVIYIGLKLFF